MGEESRDKWYAKNALGNGVKGILLWNRDCKLPRRKCNALIKINEGRDSSNANSLSVQGVEGLGFEQNRNQEVEKLLMKCDWMVILYIFINNNWSNFYPFKHEQEFV